MSKEPWASTTVDNIPWIPRDVQILLEIHLMDEENGPGPSCPIDPTVVPCTWQMTQDLYVDVASPTPSSEPLCGMLMWHHLCAPTPIGSTTGLERLILMFMS